MSYSKPACESSTIIIHIHVHVQQIALFTLGKLVAEHWPFGDIPS